MSPSTRLKEVQLFDNFYPIVGTVLESDAAQFAPKQVFGDFTKDSEQLASSIVFSDHRGGIGIKDMVEQKDFNRSDWSTSGIGTKGHLILPPLATNCGNPTTAETDCALLIKYGNTLYACFGTDVRVWIEGSQSWDASLHTLVAIPTDAIVHKDKLYFACGTDFERYDGASWTDGATLSGAAKVCRYFIEWDSKLFTIGNTGVLIYSSNEGVAWTSLVTSTLAAGSFTSLFLDYDTDNVLVISLGTTTGTYFLDFANSKWRDTGLFFPAHSYACRGASRWREASYIPVGVGVYQFKGTTTPAEITPMGPDRDYGLPSDRRGSIIKLIPEHNALYALVDASSIQARDFYPDAHWAEGVIYDDQGASVVLKWDGMGWAVVYAAAVTAEALKTGVVATTGDGDYRLWFALDRTVFYIDLNVNLQNPLEIEEQKYAASSEHIWPWFDADNAVVDKTAFAVTVFAALTSATEYIKLYIGTDYDEDTWTLQTTAAFPDGQIDADGEVEFTLASGAGLSFKAIRFKVESYRGSTNTLTPDLRWLRLSYIKTLNPQYSFQAVLDCGRDYRHKRAATLVAAVKTAYETQTLGNFTFRTYQGTSETYRVKVLRFQGRTEAGVHKEGQFEVMLVAL